MNLKSITVPTNPLYNVHDSAVMSAMEVLWCLCVYFSEAYTLLSSISPTHWSI